MSVQYPLKDAIELLLELSKIVAKAEKRGKYLPVVKWHATHSSHELIYMAEGIGRALKKYQSEALRIKKYLNPDKG